MSILWFGDLVREISNQTSHLSRSRHTMRLSRKDFKNREVVIRCFDSLNQSIWNKPQMGSINKSLSSLNQTFIGEKMLKLHSVFSKQKTLVIKNRIHPTKCDKPLHIVDRFSFLPVLEFSFLPVLELQILTKTFVQLKSNVT